MNDNVLNRIISVLNYVIIALLLALSVILFRQNGRLREALAREAIAETTTNTRTDTIWRTVHHTDTVPREILKDRVIIRSDTVVCPVKVDSMGGGELIQGCVSLPLVDKTYRGEHKDSATNTKVHWRADVEGYSLGDDEYPRLSRIDMTLDIPQPHTTTTVTNTITKRKRWNVNLGIGAGWGVTTNTPDIFLGASIGYSVY